MLEEPLDDPNLKSNLILRDINNGITYIFIVELIIKAIVFGFITNGEHSYLRNGWNILDFVIVTFSVISIIIQ